MTDKQLLEQALEALEFHSAGDEVDENLIAAIKATLEQPEEKYTYGTPLLDAMTKPAPVQEPVAWQVNGSMVVREDWIERLQWPFDYVALGRAIPDSWVPVLYTTPPAAQRQWVGLSDEEHMQLAEEWGCLSSDWVFYAAAVERKIKEKNV